MVRRSRKKKETLSHKIREYILHSKSMPLIFAVTVIGILFVLVRMKGIEQDYKLNEIQKVVDVHKIKNKELKAIKARELSVKKLKAYAKKFNLKEPNEKRIIIIQE